MAYPEGPTDPERAPRPAKAIVMIVAGLAVTLLVANYVVKTTGIIGYRVMGPMKKARQTKARADIANIIACCDMFKIDNARYPKSIEDLLSPPADAPSWDGPYLKEPNIPLDPWGSEYIYVLDGMGYMILSYGADGLPGGEGKDADISNHVP